MAVLDGEWNITPAIQLHIDVHNKRHDVRVVIHNHPSGPLSGLPPAEVPPVYDQTSALVDTDPVVYDEYRGTVEQRELGNAVANALGQSNGRCWPITARWWWVRAFVRPICAPSRWSGCRWPGVCVALGGGHPLSAEVVQATGARTDRNG
ncbi:class II aldolase/adducin family protein, partial [Staphylococcus epidermidis]|nr:class II aldolase/adducin family protein [Staphylococcus epidermidis]